MIDARQDRELRFGLGCGKGLGVVDHHLLTLHHVRDDVAEPLPWDIGFLVVGALLVLAGASLYRAGRPDSMAGDHHLAAHGVRG